jgi:hypothetical protein
MEPIRVRHSKFRATGWQKRAASRPATSANWLLKGCRRCGGDLVLLIDEFGSEDFTCLQCGAISPSGALRAA